MQAMKDRPADYLYISCMLAALFFTGAVTAAEFGPVKAAGGSSTDHSRLIEYDTERGTAMSLDTSPDGNWIIFDLAGNIYRIPSAGGQAKALTTSEDLSVNYHPRFSPDGRSIAFISDRHGQHNLWLMDADGLNPRPFIIDTESRFAHPNWTPDGESLVVTRIYGVARIGMEKRDLRLWIFSIDSGEGRELAGSTVDQAAWPSVSPDGKHLYHDASTFSTSPVAGMPHTQYHLEKLSLQTGERELLTRPQKRFRPPSLSMHRLPEFAPPDSFSPEISPDGRHLAFARRIPGGQTIVGKHLYESRTALWVRDLRSGQERVLLDPLDPDRSGTYARAVLRVNNGYAWLKDGSAILVPVNGKIRKIAFPSGEVETIPFRARVSQELQPMARAQPDIDNEIYRAPFLQWLAISPGGKARVFYAAGRLWKQDGDSQKPVLLSDMPGYLQLMPAWSPDGKWIAFVSWKDDERGHVWKVRAAGGKPVRLTRTAGEYFYPAWSPDGKHLVIALGSGETARGNTIEANLQWHLATVSSAGGKATELAGITEFMAPQWLNDNRIYVLQSLGGLRGIEELAGLPERSGKTRVLTSIAVHDPGTRVHALLPAEVSSIKLSPDNKRLVASAGYELYLAPLPGGSDIGDITFGKEEKSLRRLSAGGGWFPLWRDNETLEYLNGNTHVITQLDRENTEKTSIALNLSRDFAQGSIALTNATIINGQLGTTPRKGTLVVVNGRISCLYKCDTSKVEHVIDVKGKFIMPGLVDVHDHDHSFTRIVASRHHPHSALQLAYGVTTAVNPFGHPLLSPALADLTATGRIIGPRYLYTGMGVRGLRQAEKITSLADARRIVAAHAATGAIGIKQFHVTTRRESQLLAQATREHGGLYLTAEQGDIPYTLGLVMDGYTGWEHMLSYDTLHGDLLQYFGQSGITYSPTAIVGGLSQWSSLYFIPRARLLQDEKFTRFMPWQRLPLFELTGSRRRSEFSFPLVAEGVAGVMRAGGNAAIGAHGEVPGIGAHFEMQIYARAMSAEETIHMATLGGAKFIGASASIGSIETGKIADLLVLGANPLSDIENTLDIEYVMSMGRLYRADTLDQLWPEEKSYGPVPWTRNRELGPRVRGLDYWDSAAP